MNELIIFLDCTYVDVCWRSVTSIKRESYRGKLVDFYQ